MMVPDAGPPHRRSRTDANSTVIKRNGGIRSPDRSVTWFDPDRWRPAIRSDLLADYQTVCHVDELPVGTSRMFSVGGQLVGIFNVDGEFLAISNKCPHAGASLAHGSFDGDVVSCRIHHWRFCLRTGAYLDADKPEFNARTFKTKVVDDNVQICLRTEPSS